MTDTSTLQSIFFLSPPPIVRKLSDNSINITFNLREEFRTVAAVLLNLDPETELKVTVEEE